MICGENAWLSPESEGGCGRPIEDERNALYRCAFCHIPFHAECLKKHIANEPPPRRHATWLCPDPCRTRNLADRETCGYCDRKKISEK